MIEKLRGEGNRPFQSVAELVVGLLMDPTAEVDLIIYGVKAFSASLTVDRVSRHPMILLRNMPAQHKEGILKGMPVEDLGEGLYGIDVIKLAQQHGFTP